MKIRFLSGLIFITVLMLSVRVGNIWEDVVNVLHGNTKIESALYVTNARAQVEKDTENNAVETESAEVDGATPIEEVEVEQAPVEADTPDATLNLAKHDPALLTQAEIDLLQRLAERREELEAQEKEMSMREGLLQAAEERIDRKIAELQNFQDTIEKLVKAYDADQIKKIEGLVKIYENMKPKKTV